MKPYRSIGILNHRTVAYYYENLKHYEKSVTVVAELYEFDMDSKQYKALSENKEFTAYQVYGAPKKKKKTTWYYDKTEAVASAINKQYVLYIYAYTGNVDVEEEKAPFTISQAKKIYDAFKEL